MLAGPAGIGPAVTYAQACMSQSETRAAVSSGKARSFSTFSAALQQQGQVVSSCLARNGNSYVYVGKLLKPNGQLVPFSISAN